MNDAILKIMAKVFLNDTIVRKMSFKFKPKLQVYKR